MQTPKNARSRPVTQLCLALETFRRTSDGRVRDAKAFLAHFFPEAEGGANDRLFVHMPKEVRAGLLSNWGIRGKKSALRDDDDRVRTTITDALAAGDIDAAIIEEAVTPEILVDWVPLEEWWAFWRGASLPGPALRQALGVARTLSLFEDRWFLDHLSLSLPKLSGLDVICSALSKDQIVGWIHSVHASGDASPTGLVAALGWETVLAKTAEPALLSALDKLAREIGLAAGGGEPGDRAAPPGAATKADVPKAEPPKPEPPKPELPKPEPPKPELPKPELPKPELPKAELPKAEPAKAEPVKHEPAKVEPPKLEGVRPDTAKPEPAKAPPAPVRPPMSPLAKSSPGMPAWGGLLPIPTTADPLREPKPVAAAIAKAAQSAPPRILFAGAGELPPMRPRQVTLSGVGDVPDAEPTPPLGVPTFEPPPLEDPPWAPARAEPGDMGWDILYGLKRSMGTNVSPRYNFDDDDEPTSEIALDDRRG